jgi:hypothetical protein
MDTHFSWDRLFLEFMSYLDEDIIKAMMNHFRCLQPMKRFADFCDCKVDAVWEQDPKRLKNWFFNFLGYNDLVKRYSCSTEFITFIDSHTDEKMRDIKYWIDKYYTADNLEKERQKDMRNKAALAALVQECKQDEKSDRREKSGNNTNDDSALIDNIRSIMDFYFKAIIEKQNSTQ